MKVIDIARSYIGEQEKPNNSGFKNPEFEAKMKKVGFKKGEAWCCYFCELVYKESYPELDLDKLFSASTQKTWKNFQDFGEPNFILSNIPDVGDLVVWRSKKNPSQGHIGIVSNYSNKTFTSIEGNTNDKGGREGYIVAEKTRYLTGSGTLELLGFIHHV